MQSLTHYTVNLTQGVRINSEESCNLWKNEISPHLQKLPLREYIIHKLNITKDVAKNLFKTKITFLFEIIQRVLSDFKGENEQWIHLYSAQKFNSLAVKLCCTPDNLNLNVVSFAVA